MKIDINCDVGEGIANEHLLMPYISSCNIACGGHFGNAETIDKTIQLAIENEVLIGAHPSFPDTKNFGRKVLNISEEELQKSIESQLDLFVERLSFFDEKLHHIKPHGALYNLITIDVGSAKTFIKLIEKYSKDVFLYVPYNSVIEKIALENNIKIKYEAFADRNYNDNLTLVSRNQENALITDVEEVFNHVLFMVQNQKVKTISGLKKTIKADTFCVHGDNANSLEIVRYLSDKLKKKELKLDYKPTYKLFGKQAILIEWQAIIDEEILNDILLFKNKIATKKEGFYTDIIIGYNSLTIKYKQEISDFYKEVEDLKSFYKTKGASNKTENFIWEIPVCYDVQFGIDLEQMAIKSKLSIEEIIQLHSEKSYTVFFIGFLPGFLYLGGLDEQLFFDRKQNPRFKVAKGSVAIGGKQTGIYPSESAGGWNIIGLTPVNFFDINSENPCFSKAGDKIKFNPISLDEFYQIEKKIVEKKYKIIKTLCND